MSAHHLPVCLSQDIVGEVLVSLKCLPICQKMEVGLLKARTTSLQSTADKSKVLYLLLYCASLHSAACYLYLTHPGGWGGVGEKGPLHAHCTPTSTAESDHKSA